MAGKIQILVSGLFYTGRDTAGTYIGLQNP